MEQRTTKWYQDMDKVAKIRAEIERLKKCSESAKMEWIPAGYNQNAFAEDCRIASFNKLLSFIDSIQEEPNDDWKYSIAEKLGISREEYDKIDYNKDYGKEEPVSEDLEEAANNALERMLDKYDLVGTGSCLEMFKLGAEWQKTKDESCSKDLGEYINELSKQFQEVSFAKLSRIAVRVVKWQKEQDKSTIELAEDHAMLAGMEKMKEQMMAKAIDADCFGFQGAALFSFRLPADNYLVGSEVKVIVIKEG